MQKIGLVFTILLIQLTINAQTISYEIPEGYEKNISAEDYKTLVDLSIPIIKARYKVDNVKNGTVYLLKDQDFQALNLHNIITKCISLSEKTQWKSAIEEHFRKLFASVDEQRKIDPEKFETIRNNLSLRIYPEAFIIQRGGHSNFISKKDLEGTYTLLMLDLPDAFTPVNKKMFELWKKDTAEIFRIAQTNINKQSVEKVTKKFDFDSTTIEISFLGNEDYAASYALDLMHNSPELVGELGSVVAIPNKGIADICKITKSNPLGFVKFIQMIKPLIDKSFAEHDQPVSDQFYWYYKGRFTRIIVKLDEKENINVFSPDELSLLLVDLK